MITEVTMRIQQRKRDIENWETIKRFLTIYLAEQALPLFKKRKTVKYVDAMASFSKDEVQNAKNQ